MEIKVCETSIWSDDEWKSYLTSFNIVFGKSFTADYFKHKYLSSCDKSSYHALLLNDVKEVVGGCTVIPYQYYKSTQIIKIGLAVDVFIREEYREDPLMLRRMYKQLTKLLIEKSIIAVMAVPNATAYPYWKNVVKWKDVGNINYWALPVHVGNIINKFRLLNSLSLLYCYSSLVITSVLSLFKFSQKAHKYHIVESNSFIDERFDESYLCQKDDDIINYFKLFDEDGVKTAYLIYSRESNVMTLKSLYKGVNHIIKNYKVDLILFVGPINFFQSLLVKIPRKFEPKLLPVTCDILLKDNIEKFNDMHDLENWDFGLLNYDVR